MRSVAFQLVLGVIGLCGLAGFLMDPQAHSQAARDGAAGATSRWTQPYTADALWRSTDVSLAALNCPDDVGACLRQAAANSVQTPAALDFFNANRAMLLGYAPATPVAVGRVEAWSDDGAQPALAFLNGTTQFQWVDDVLRANFDVTPEHPERSLSQDPIYSTLLKALSPMAFMPGHNPAPAASQDQRLESISTLGSGEQQVVVQVGIQRGCERCGSGIAERYAFGFGSDGDLLSVKLLGMCQGGPVPGVAADGGSQVYQEFGGPQFFHLLGAPLCPPHTGL